MVIFWVCSVPEDQLRAEFLEHLQILPLLWQQEAKSEHNSRSCETIIMGKSRQLHTCMLAVTTLIIGERTEAISW